MVSLGLSTSEANSLSDTLMKTRPGGRASPVPRPTGNLAKYSNGSVQNDNIHHDDHLRKDQSHEAHNLISWLLRDEIRRRTYCKLSVELLTIVRTTPHQTSFRLDFGRRHEKRNKNLERTFTILLVYYYCRLHNRDPVKDSTR